MTTTLKMCPQCGRPRLGAPWGLCRDCFNAAWEADPTRDGPAPWSVRENQSTRRARQAAEQTNAVQAEQRARISEMNAAYDWQHRHELVTSRVTRTEP